MRKDELQNHVFTTYFNLRLGIACIAILFPIALWISGKLIYDLPLQNSISAYYHGGRLTRDIFVGFLVTVGAFLYLYKGYSNWENIALNVAGACAIGVAFFPMEWVNEQGEVVFDAVTLFNRFSLHGTCAILLFLCIAYVCIWRASDTLELLKDIKMERRYKRIYTTLGIGMILFPLGAALLSMVFGIAEKWVFFIETAGILIFAIYWWTKSREISFTNADQMALRGDLET